MQGEFIPALIQAISEGRFSLAFRSFTGHAGYLEQDHACRAVAEQLGQLLQFFQDYAEHPHVARQVLMGSQDTINEMQAFQRLLTARQAKFQEMLQKIDQD